MSMRPAAERDQSLDATVVAWRAEDKLHAVRLPSLARALCGLKLKPPAENVFGAWSLYSTGRCGPCVTKAAQ